MPDERVRETRRRVMAAAGAAGRLCFGVTSGTVRGDATGWNRNLADAASVVVEDRLLVDATGF